MLKTALAGHAVRLLLGTAAFAATTHIAAAQPFFRGWGGYYAPAPFYYDDDYYSRPYAYGRPGPYGGPGPYYAPGSGGLARLDPGEIAGQAAAAGFRLVAPLRPAGRTFVAVGEDRNGRRHRLVFDAADGHLIGDKRLDETRRTGALAAAPKPPAGDKRAPVATPVKAEPEATKPPVSPDATPAAPTPPAGEGTRVRVEKDPLALPPAPEERASPQTPSAAPHPAAAVPAAPAAAAAGDASPAPDVGRSANAPASTASPPAADK